MRASSACPTAAKNLFRPTDPLEYIVGQGFMKYGGEMLMEFTILNDFEWTHLSCHLVFVFSTLGALWHPSP
jgi:hypothetical protein